MSDYEMHTGKIKPVEYKDNETLEQVCKRLWVESGEDIDEDFDIDDLLSEYYDKYFLVDDTLYEILEDEVSDYQDSFCTINKNDDGTLSFSTMFYNGGTCLTEMLEDRVKKINKGIKSDDC